MIKQPKNLWNCVDICILTFQRLETIKLNLYIGSDVLHVYSE